MASIVLRAMGAALAVCAVALAVALWGCSGEAEYANTPYGNIHHSKIFFRDDAPFATAADPERPAEAEISQLSFVDLDGQQGSLSQFVGKQPVVVVVTRGNVQPLCVYCSTQTSRIIAQYEEFRRRGAEVVVLFPVQAGSEKRLADFIVSTKKKLDAPPEKIPFPMWLDVDLKAVDRLKIRQDLSRPATYILDREGRLRFAHVGKNLTDRPSVKAVLAKLDELQAEK